MSDFVVLGLVIQIVALGLLFAKLGRTWFRHLGAIFILMAVLYHGVGEILIALFPSENPYRPLFDPKYVGQFVLLVSMAILVLTIAYVWAIGKRPGPVPPADTPGAALTKRIFDYRLMLLVTVPLLILTLGGQGYGSNGGLNGGAGIGTTLGLTQQFFILGIVLSGFGFVMRFGRRWIFPVLVAQSLTLAVTGQRFPILIGAVMLIYALSLLGMKFERRLVFGLVVLVLLAWVITASRAAEGRYATTSAASVRLTFLTTGLSNLFTSSTGQGLAFTLGYRLDGNSYGAMSLEALDNGSSPVGLTPLKNDVLLAIPSFLNPSKDRTAVEDRSEKLYVEHHLPIPELQTSAGNYLDILPTQLGALTGILGPIGLFFAAFALGLAFAALDRWLRRGLGPMRILVSLGVLYCVLDYEGSWDTYTTTARGILLLLALMVPILAIKQATQRAYRRAGSSDHWTVSIPPGAGRSRQEEFDGSQ
jgi:hypothetical protein